MKRPPETLTQAEVVAIVSELAGRSPEKSLNPTRDRVGVRNAAIVAVFYRCGLRSQELIDLDMRDFDAEARTLRVRHGKGDKCRLVGLDDFSLDYMTRCLVARGNEPGPIFKTSTGQRLQPSYLRKFLPKVAEQCGIEKRVHPHGMRHTCASEMVNEGVSLHLIRDVLGHGNISTTDTYLRQVNPKQVLDAMRSRPLARTG